jgi:hypothetical protein
MVVSERPSEGAGDYCGWNKPRRMMLSAAMNGFYGLKQITGSIHVPASFPSVSNGTA